MADSVCLVVIAKSRGNALWVQLWPEGNYGRDVVTPKRTRPIDAQSEVLQIAAQR
jgi:hypothetical protein